MSMESTSTTISTTTTTTSGENNVKVCVRVRPSSLSEHALRRCILVNQQNNAIILDCKPDSKMFTFDYVAEENSSQEDIFNIVGKPITDAFMGGYNATVFAYGQTGSGKTYTIQGGLTESGDLIPEQRGLIPRIFEYLFALMKREAASGNVTYSCKCSFLEIYNEAITDLLEPASTMMQIREDAKRGVYVEGLREEAVDSASAAHNVLLHGSRNRHVGYTTMNAASSRSHSVLTLYVQSRVINSEGLTNVRFSKLNLIDLAGSERQRSTDAVGVRLKEAGNINKSLSALGNVIRALVDVADGKPRHVHYRDSKLTFILKDSLGGNSKTCIIATVSPAGSCFGESLSTLKFAQRAKLIRNTAVINEDTGGSIVSLKAEVRRLKEELAARGMGMTEVSGGSGVPVFERVRDLEVLLSKALDEEDELRNQKSKVEEQLKDVRTLCDRKDTFIMNAKMVIRLRDSQIARLEQSRHSHSDEYTPTADEEELREEIGHLKEAINCHPDVMRFAIENLELREQLKKFEDTDRNDEELAALRHHNQELARQVRVLIHEKEGLLALVNGKGEKERWVEVQRMEDELNIARRELDEERLLRQANLRELVEFERINEDNEHTMQENQKAYEMERESLRASHQRLLETMEDVYNKKIEDGAGTSRDNIARLAAAQGEIQELHTRCQQLQAEAKSRNENIRHLRNQLEKTSYATKRLSEVYQQEIQELRDRNVDDMNVDTFQTREEGILNSSLEGLKQEGVNRTSLERQDVNRHSEEVNFLKRKADDLQEQLSTLREEHETLVEEAQYLREQVGIKEEQISSSVVQLQESQAECDRLTEKVAEYQPERFEAYMKIDGLNQQLKEEMETNAALTKQLAEYAFSSTSISDEKPPSDEVIRLRENEEMRNREFVALNQELGAAKLKVDDLRQMLEEKTNSLEAVHRMVEEIQAKKENDCQVASIQELDHKNKAAEVEMLKDQLENALVRVREGEAMWHEREAQLVEVNENALVREREAEAMRREQEAQLVEANDNALAREREAEAMRREQEAQLVEVKRSLEEAYKENNEIRRDYSSHLDTHAQLEEYAQRLQDSEMKVVILTEDIEKYILLKKEGEKEKQDLQKENNTLRQQNAKLIGHNNRKQKLQHHIKIKEENNTLLRENGKLTAENRRLQRELSKNRSEAFTQDDLQNTSFSNSMNSSFSFNLNNSVLHDQEPDLITNTSLTKSLGSDMGNKENQTNLNSSFDASHLQ